MSQNVIPDTSEDIKKFICNKCDKSFASKQSVSRHRLYYCKSNEIHNQRSVSNHKFYNCNANEIHELKKQISMATDKLEEIIGLLNNKVDNVINTNN